MERDEEGGMERDRSRETDKDRERERDYRNCNGRKKAKSEIREIRTANNEQEFTRESGTLREKN